VYEESEIRLKFRNECMKPKDTETRQGEGDGDGFAGRFGRAAELVAASGDEGRVRLTVVLIGTEVMDSVRRVMGEVMGQTRSGELELVLASESEGLLEEAGEWLRRDGRLGAWQLLRGDVRDMARLRLGCVVRARGDLVVFAEDHTFQPPGWAEGLVGVFDRYPEAVAVSPCLSNPSDRTAISRVQYAYFNAGAVARVGETGAVRMGRLPWHNTAYRTEQVRRVVCDEAMLEFEAALQEELCRVYPGGCLLLDGGTVIGHFYMGRLRPALLMAFYGGVIVGDWLGGAWWKRGLRVVGFPVVAMRRLAGAKGKLTAGPVREWAGTVVVALVLAVVHAFGEAWGSCFGRGDAAGRYADLETRRYRFVGAAERAQLLS
jgi:hypothetical protein